MVLVTGATGHIGNVLVRKLIEKGEKVRALVMPGDNSISLEGLKLQIIEGDVRNSKDVMMACEGIDVVYHLAAIISIVPGHKKLIYDVNVGGVENILKAVKEAHVRRLIYTSSVHAFSEPKVGSVINEKIPFDPSKTAGTYGKSKATAVLKVIQAVHQDGIDAVVICPAGVIGPYDYKLSEMGKVILRYMRDKLKINIKGAFDFVDVRDVVEGEIAAAEKGKRGEVYILSGEQISMEKFMEILKEITGKSGPVFSLPKYTGGFISLFSALYSFILKRKALFTPYTVHTLTRHYTFSHEKAFKELGYSPRPIFESITDTVKWFEKNEKFKEIVRVV